jgi:hypothetical protein
MLRGGAERARCALERHLVWMMGSPRSGTTWLLNLLAAHPRIRSLDEPLIGAHLGIPASVTVGTVAHGPRGPESGRALDVFRGRADYFFSDRYRDAWAAPLRTLILTRLLAQVTADGGDPRQDLVIVKEPHGSEAADLLIGVLPQSRLLIVTRDGRDVVDSILDAISPGAWASTVATLDDAGDVRQRFVEECARLWVERMRVVLQARESVAAGQWLLTRYEDLLAEPTSGVRRILDWLKLGDWPELESHVQRLAFDRVPAEHRGAGKFHRAATPGLWREHLSPAEQRAATDIMGPTLRALGYDV